MRKNWKLRDHDSELEARLAGALNISPIVARILVNRKLSDEREARNFLFGDISFTYDPFLLKDMHKAVDRIKNAISAGQKILVYGDYDVDGITSVALLTIVLRELGTDPVTYIPNRLEEGYGLNKKAVKFAHTKKVKLIITVDCGISAIDEVKYANSLGIDVIVTDHHEIKEGGIPEAFAVINPHQKDCVYPFQQLAGVGLAYKLACALTRKRYYPMERHLDLVALGTVADVAPQKSENRIFTKHGLTVMNDTDKIGLRSLIRASGLAKKDISASHIGYILGPRINAMGRIGSPEVALKLLLTDNKLEADKLAGVLNKENANRQKIEARMMDEALSKVEREVNFKDHRVIVLAGDGWHPGVIGIAASRIQERFYRPTIMIALKGKTGKGSGRSIHKFHLFNSLEHAKDCLIDFGGHETACGLSINRKDVDRFRDKINAYAMKMIKDEDLLPSINVDVDIPLSHLNERLISELDLLKPYGPDNPRPVFMSSGIMLSAEPRFVGKNGFKMWLKSDGFACEAISFRRSAMPIPAMGESIDIAYTPGMNNWQGIESIQLDLRDIRVR